MENSKLKTQNSKRNIYWDKNTIEKIRKGYYTAVYFNRTKHILEQEKNFKTVTMQIFQKNEGSILCGIAEVIGLFKVGAGYWENKNSKFEYQNPKQNQNHKSKYSKWIKKSNAIRIETLKDGDKISAWETVMHITGPYAYFAHLESLYLGVLARRTLVATNSRKCVQAARGKPVIFFADRFDHFQNQEGDGYAAYVGGVDGVCTQAHGAWWKGIPSGTIPHSLITINDGNTTTSAELFHKYFPKEKLIALVDFDNDCVETSLEVARILGKKLWGVRLDTAGNIVDKSIGIKNHESRIMDNNKYCGVNPLLVRLVRNALDKEGFKHVKIAVSGGFTEEKIRWFENEKAPVDVYGVGSSLLKGNNDFTADIVKVEDKLVSKVGRTYFENRRMHVINI